MRDDVVQLARDARPLGGRRDLRLLVALELEPRRPLFELDQVVAPHPEAVAEHQSDEPEDRGREDRAPRSFLPTDDREHGADLADRERDERDTPRPIRRHGEQADQQREVERLHRDVERELQQPREREYAERCDRGPAPERQRDAHDPGDDGARRRVLVTWRDERRGEEERGEQAVDDRLVMAGPRQGPDRRSPRDHVACGAAAGDTHRTVLHTNRVGAAERPSVSRTDEPENAPSHPNE